MAFLRLATTIRKTKRNTVHVYLLCLSLFTVANAETGLVIDIGTGLISGSPRQIVDAGGYVLFESLDSQGALDGIWRSDGTEAGTFELENYGRFGVKTFHSEKLFRHNGLTYFVADGSCACNNPVGLEIFVTDGTAAGTQILKDINPGGADGIKEFNHFSIGDVAPDLVAIGGTLFFAADDGVNGFELWKSDGTAAGTVMVKDIFPGSDDSMDLPRLTVVGSEVFFFAMDSEAVGIALWKSDGTEAGTVMVADTNPTAGGSSIPGVQDRDGIIAATDDKLFFRGSDGNEIGLYVSDGTSAGTIKLLATSSTNFMDSFTTWRNQLLFRFSDFPNTDLWVSDGTAQGTFALNSSGFSKAAELNGELYFAGSGGNFGEELWKTDGTDAGTVQVVNINSNGSSSPQEITNVNGVLYFSADISGTGRELYRSDGTPQGTFLLADLDAGNSSSTPLSLAASGGGLFFCAEEDGTGRELFYSCCDGALKTSINVASDTNNNGAGDIALTSKNQSGATQLRVHDSSSGSLLRQPTFFGPSWIAKQVISYDAGNTVVLGLVAIEESGLLGIQLKDAGTGNAIRNLFPWSANWTFQDAAVVEGGAPGGGPAIAILATRKSDALMGVELRNPDDNTRIRIIYPLGFGWSPMAMETLTANGDAAIAVLATRDMDQLTIVQVRNASNGALIRNVFPLGFGWSPLELKIVPDLNGNGVDEIAVRMTRDSDGLMIIQVRDGSSNALVGNVYPIGVGGNGWTTHQFEALNVNGNTALAILSVRDSDKQTLLQLKDVQTGAILKNNFFIGTPWELRESFAVIPNYSGGSSDEIAVPVRNSQTGQELVQIRDGFDTSVIRNVFVPD